MTKDTVLDIDTAISVIENCEGFSDPTSSVGGAWQVVLAHLAHAERVVVAFDAIESGKVRLATPCRLPDGNGKFRDSDWHASHWSKSNWSEFSTPLLTKIETALKEEPK